MRDYFYEGIKRLDWGFGNPNITAAMIACLMMAVWYLAWLHRSGFWVALAGFSTLGVMLIQTVSRGGVIAAITGGVILVWFAPRPWSRSRGIAIVVCVTGLLGFSIWHGVASRYTQGIVEEDRSISNRWLIYRVAPSMIVDAPAGWGAKRAAEAFHNFYQPVQRVERYGSLVSSHLTWLVEFNWLQRFAYLFVWLTVLFLCWPGKFTKGASWYSPALATWVAFGAASALTMMTNRWWMWTVPAAVLLPVLIVRLIRRQWPEWRRWAIPVCGAAGILMGVFIMGKVVPSVLPVRLDQGFVVMGSEDPERRFFVLSIDEQIMGKAYGQRIRGSLLEKELEGVQVWIEWVSSLPDPGIKDLVVVVGDGVNQLEGRRLATLRHASGLIFLNPGAPSKELFENLAQMPPIRIKWGEFNPSQNHMAWETLASQHENVEFNIIPAAGVYLPDWVDCLRE
ncbi:MAG: TMEM8 family protein [Candidatus Marinimicrobia bacterium]|nr:TMEM8 family protein [Candidatus Neomarinimicrobiota bacterium]